MKKPLLELGKKKFEAMVEDATVDCYNPSEQAAGWFTMIDEHLKVPLQTELLGVSVTVEKVDLNQNEDIVAICRRGKHRQTVPVLDLPLSAPLPAGAEWIEAYRRWMSGE
ncbi:MAG: calcium-binding protein [Actinomycetota bacterium]